MTDDEFEIYELPVCAVHHSKHDVVLERIIRPEQCGISGYDANIKKPPARCPNQARWLIECKRFA